MNKRKTPGKGTRKEKKERPKSKQKITPQSAERTMGSFCPFVHAGGRGSLKDLAIPKGRFLVFTACMTL
jgi:hypothetical protein